MIAERSVHHNAYRNLAAKLPYNMRKGWSITYLPYTDEYAVKILDEPDWGKKKILPRVKATIYEHYTVFPSDKLIAQIILVMG